MDHYYQFVRSVTIELAFAALNVGLIGAMKLSLATMMTISAVKVNANMIDLIPRKNEQKFASPYLIKIDLW